MFKRKRFKLPKFPPALRPFFESLSVAVDPEHVGAIRPQIVTRLRERIDALEAQGMGYDKQLLALLHERVLYLLDHYSEFPRNKRHLAMGAVRYCTATEDALPEGVFLTGQRDDTQVMNYVLEELGLDDLCIE